MHVTISDISYVSGEHAC